MKYHVPTGFGFSPTARGFILLAMPPTQNSTHIKAAAHAVATAATAAAQAAAAATKQQSQRVNRSASAKCVFVGLLPFLTTLNNN